MRRRIGERILSKIKELDFIVNNKNRNRGFSLIEIIVTIAVMAIVIGATMSIYSWIKSHRIKNIAENISDAIGDVRTKTLSKEGSYELIIRKNTSGKYEAVISSTSGSETNVIGNVGTISCTSDDGLTEYKVGTDYEIHLAFNKSDGSFSTIKVKKSDGTLLNIKNEIHIEYAGLSKNIKLKELTGKHYIE